MSNLPEEYQGRPELEKEHRKTLLGADGESCLAVLQKIPDATLTDLLSGGAVFLRDPGEYGELGGASGPILQGAAHVQLESLQDALALLRAGELHKKVLATAMNDASSRGHTVFLLTITQRGAERGGGGGGSGGAGGAATGAAPSEDGDESAAAAATAEGVGGGDGERLITSQLALVDLAG